MTRWAGHFSLVFGAPRSNPPTVRATRVPGFSPLSGLCSRRRAQDRLPHQPPVGSGPDRAGRPPELVFVSRVSCPFLPDLFVRGAQGRGRTTVQPSGRLSHAFPRGDGRREPNAPLRSTMPTDRGVRLFEAISGEDPRDAMPTKSGGFSGRPPLAVRRRRRAARSSPRSAAVVRGGKHGRRCCRTRTRR